MITPGRQLMAFVFRDFSLTNRYLGWFVVFTFYAMVNSATIALIGVAAKDEQLTLTLIVGVLLWSFLSALFSEIAGSVAYERWEGTLENSADILRVRERNHSDRRAIIGSTFVARCAGR